MIYRFLIGGVLALLGVLVIVTSSSACSISDIGCLDLKMPTIDTRNLRLDNQPVLRQPEQLILKRETSLAWCSAYFKNRRGQRTTKTDLFCHKVLSKSGD